MREVELRSAPVFRGTQGNPAGIRVRGAFFGDFLLRQKVARQSREAAGEIFFSSVPKYKISIKNEQNLVYSLHQNNTHKKSEA